MFGKEEKEEMEIIEINEKQFSFVSKSESCGMEMVFEHRIRRVEEGEGKGEEKGGEKGEKGEERGKEKEEKEKGKGKEKEEKEEKEENCILELYYSSKSLTWLAWCFSWMSYFMSGIMKKIILQDLNDIKNAAEKL